MATYLLFEESLYPTSLLERLGIYPFVQKSTKSSGIGKVPFVGLTRTSDGHTVFSFPKVFKNSSGLFSKYSENDLAGTDLRTLLSKEDFLKVWKLGERIFFALKRVQGTTDLFTNSSDVPQFVSSHSASVCGPFEALVNLIQFSKDNPTLVVMRTCKSKANPFSKQNWNRVFRDEAVFRSKDKKLLVMPKYSPALQPTAEDRLIQIYCAVLSSLKRFQPDIQLPSGIAFADETMLKSPHKVRSFLLNSKNRYFSDKMRRLHFLLRCYFGAEFSRARSNIAQFLFVMDFQIVFEKMVDGLLSDSELLDNYKFLKDGKEIDHLYGDSDLFGQEKIIFIGDSKYYLDHKKIKPQKHKQFTYARNIIQENITVHVSGGELFYSQNYRDDLTEGYNVTPNFFVWGIAEKTLQESSLFISKDDLPSERSWHFPNRLFDRDTLHILYFKIDFISLLNFFVVKRGPDVARLATRRTVARSLVRSSFVEYLDQKYQFYTFEDNEAFVRKNLDRLLGKVYSFRRSKRSVLALERDAVEENQNVIETFEKNGVALTIITAQETGAV